MLAAEKSFNVGTHFKNPARQYTAKAVLNTEWKRTLTDIVKLHSEHTVYKAVIKPIHLFERQVHGLLWIC